MLTKSRSRARARRQVRLARAARRRRTVFPPNMHKCRKSDIWRRYGPRVGFGCQLVGVSRCQARAPRAHLPQRSVERGGVFIPS